MPKTKVAVSLDAALLKAVDAQVKRKQFASRSAAIEAAIRAYSARVSDEEYDRLIAQIDPEEEKAWAELRFAGEVFG